MIKVEIQLLPEGGNQKMDNLYNLDNRRKIKYLDKNVKELNEVVAVLKKSIQDLTKYEKYSSIRRRVEDLFVLYQDIKRARDSKLEIITRLKNEQ